MDRIHFIKMQAVGNDFVLIDARGLKRNWSNLAKVICRRRFGIGADGLLLILKSNVADFRMRIFNPDGSEAEVSGNGLRCFAKYLVERSPVKGPELKIETLSGIRVAKVEMERGTVKNVWIAMGVPRLAPDEIPVLVKGQKGKDFDIKSIINYPVNIEGRDLEISCISLGNPHAVSFLSEEVSDFPLPEIGPKIENHPIFPNRTNFEIVNVKNRREAVARVWERGVGETLSCGSGACAIAVAARLRNSIDDSVDIILKGGKLKVEWDGIGEVWLAGPAEEVFEGEWLER